MPVYSERMETTVETTTIQSIQLRIVTRSCVSYMLLSQVSQHQNKRTDDQHFFSKSGFIELSTSRRFSWPSIITSPSLLQGSIGSLGKTASADKRSVRTDCLIYVQPIFTATADTTRLER